MQFIFSVIVFLLVLGFLVFIHELGHFMVAKWTGMRVDEFAIGFPPRIFGRKKGETLYALNAIPFGGYVKIHGENAEEDHDDPRAFDKKPVWARLAVMLAGITMNVLFAIIALIVAFSVGFISVAQDLTQIPGAVVKKSDVIITSVLTDAPADKAGIQPGDIIRGFRTADGITHEIRTADQLVSFTKQLQETGVTSVVVDEMRNGEEKSITSAINPTGLALGISLQSLDTVRVPVTKAPAVALKETGAIIKVTWEGLKDFGSKLFTKGELDKNVSGPIGIYKTTAVAARTGFAEVLFIMIVLSLNLALLNLLPLPALDGGRVVFLIIEGIFRKRVIQRQVEGWLTTISFLFLIGLMLVLTFRDILNLF